MDPLATLKVAIDLMHFPSQVHRIRSAPVPNGIALIFCILSGDEKVTNEAVQAVGRSRETVRMAAAFFVEQILLFPEADSYRVLGARPGANGHKLRRNMALLLRWLHPDLDRQQERSVFAARVTRAWDDLKTQERRAAYDRKQAEGRERSKKQRNRHHPSRPQNAGYLAQRRHRTSPAKYIGLLRRVLKLLVSRSAL